jgi:hypothetical protein
MIIYVNEDAAYLSWLSRHRGGFVVDGLRRPTRKRATLHRAGCDLIKKSKSKATHWTTGRRFKACSLDLQELVAWAQEEFLAAPVLCEQCAPLGTAESKESPRRLTKLGREILDAVIESAVIHLDNGDADYRLTIADLADRLGKSPTQLAAALSHLVDEGLLRTEEDVSDPADRQVYPTALALKSLPSFESTSAEEIAKELDRLRLHGQLA